MVSSYAALDVGGRVTSARGAVRRLWLIGGATAMGIGIWSMHYVGMLAFRLPVRVEYDWPMVLVSLLAAVAASVIALYVVSRKTMGTYRAVLGSLFMGGAIAGMHYIGMAAMRLPAMCYYNDSIVAVSVALAIVASLAALWLTFRFRAERRSGGWRKLLAALAMGAGIPLMHYTGMAAATLVPSTAMNGSLMHALSITSLGTAGIIVVTFMVLGLTILTSIVDRRFSAQAMELESSERRSRQILETAFDAFVGMDASGKITDWNAQAEKILGWSQGDVMGRNFAELMIPDRCRQLYEQNVRQLLDSSENKLPNRRFETRVTCQSGREIPAEITVSVIESGKQRHLAAFVRDLAERERAEEKFRGVVDACSEAILFVNVDGQIVVANAQAEKLFGYSREELLNQKIEMLIPEPARSDHSEYTTEFFKNPRTRPMSAGLELRTRRKDGSKFPAEISLTPLKTEAGMLVSTLILDITARQERENALKDTHERLALLLADTEERAHESTRIAELLDILQSCQTAEEAYKVAQACLPEIFLSASGALCLISASRNAVEAVASWGTLATEMTFRPEDCWALRRGKLQHVYDGRATLRCAHVTGATSDGYLCVPLAAQGETLGVLYLECLPPDPNAVPASGVHPAEVLARQAVAVGERISLALANLGLREALRLQSTRDTLTGLFNRRYMEETLERELKRAARNKESVSVLMFDIDHFKRFNDTFGHQAGDTLLREFGEFLLHKIRGHDIACRYGGEEFAVILPGASFENGLKRADALRAGVKQLVVQHAGQVLGMVTVSIGVSAFPGRGNSDDLLRAADEALYRAKAGGRDSVVADDLQSGEIADDRKLSTTNISDR